MYTNCVIDTWVQTRQLRVFINRRFLSFDEGWTEKETGKLIFYNHSYS